MSQEGTGMKTYPWPARAVIWVLLLTWSGSASGQGPTLPGGPPAALGGDRSLLGPPLGATGGGADVGPGGAMEEPISGRVGPSVPRVPAAATAPDQRRVGVPEREGIAAPPALPLAE